MAIQNTLVGNASATQVFVASTGTECAITTMIFCNTSLTEDATMDLWVVPYGQVAGDPINQVLNKVEIPHTETFVMDSEKLIMGGGDAVWAKVAEGAADQIVNACVSYVNIS
jgi:hypothetical protein